MIREPVVAGTFYPADAGVLRTSVEDFISGSRMTADPCTIGIVSPHAGYIYSGAVAGAAYASAPDVIGTVVILAPPHRFPVAGYSVFHGEGFRTPLGVAPVALDITERLLEAGCVFQPGAHMSEHSAEVQIPFAQVRWPGATITVVLQGDGRGAASQTLANMVVQALEGVEDTMIVASSDLSHYHPQRTARDLDGAVMDAWLSGDPGLLEEVVKKGRGEACGAGPMLTLMHYAALRGANDFRRVSYDTSATASGDSSAVVGYFAGAVGSTGEAR